MDKEKLFNQVVEFLEKEGISVKLADNIIEVPVVTSDAPIRISIIEQDTISVVYKDENGLDMAKTFDSDIEFDAFKDAVLSLAEISLHEIEVEQVVDIAEEINLDNVETAETVETQKVSEIQETMETPTIENGHATTIVLTDIDQYINIFEDGNYIANCSYVLLTINEGAFKFSVDEDGNFKFEMPEKTVPKNLDTEELQVNEKSYQQMIEEYTKKLSKAKIDENTGKYVYKEVSQDIFSALLSGEKQLTESHIDESVRRFQIEEFKKSAHFILNSAEIDNLEQNAAIDIVNGNSALHFQKLEDNKFAISGNVEGKNIEISIFDITEKDKALNLLIEECAHIDFGNITDIAYLFKEGAPLTPEEIKLGLTNPHISYSGHEGYGSELAGVLNYMQRKKAIAECQLDVLDRKKREILYRLNSDKGLLRRFFARIFRPISMFLKGVFKMQLTPEQEALKQIKDAKKDIILNLSNLEKGKKDYEKVYNIQYNETLGELVDEDLEKEKEELSNDENENKQTTPQSKSPQNAHDFSDFSMGDSVLDDNKFKRTEKIKDISMMPRNKQIEHFFNIVSDNYQIEVERPNKETFESVVTITNGEKAIQVLFNAGRNQLNVPPLDEIEANEFNMEEIKKHLTLANVYSVELKNEKENKSMFSPDYIAKLSDTENKKFDLIGTLESGKTFNIRNGVHDISLIANDNGSITMKTNIGGIENNYSFPASKNVEDIMALVTRFENYAILEAFKSETRNAFINHISNSPVLNQDDSIMLSDFKLNERNYVDFNLTISGNVIPARFSVLTHSATLSDDAMLTSDTEQRIVKNLFQNIERSFVHCCINEFQLPLNDFVESIDVFAVKLKKAIEEALIPNVEEGTTKGYYCNGLSYEVEHKENDAYQLTVKNKGMEELHKETLYVAPDHEILSPETISKCYQHTLSTYPVDAKVYMEQLTKAMQELSYNVPVYSDNLSYNGEVPRVTKDAINKNSEEINDNGEKWSKDQSYFEDQAKDDDVFSHDNDELILSQLDDNER